MEIRKLQKRILREERRRNRNSSRRRRTGFFLLAGVLLLFAGAGFYLYNLQEGAAGRFRSAQQLLEQGNYHRAAKAFRGVYERHPDSKLAPRALFEAGQVRHLFLKQHQEALLAFLLVEKDYPHSELVPRARRRVAEIYKYRLRDYGEAVVAYQKLLDGGPGDGDVVQYEIADTYFRLNNYEQARIEFESLLKRWPETPLAAEVRYRIATTLALDGDLEGAGEAFRDVAEQYPEDPFAVEARFALAGVLEEQERLREARGILEGLEGEYPNPEALARRLGEVRERIKRKKEAI